jgi:hypothetical protein
MYDKIEQGKHIKKNNNLEAEGSKTKMKGKKAK